MIDFSTLFRNPLLLFGAAAQFGIFFTIGVASFTRYCTRKMLWTLRSVPWRISLQ